MAKISELGDDAADIAPAPHAQRGEGTKRRQAPGVPGTRASTMETRSQSAATTAEKAQATKARAKTAGWDHSYTPAQTDPFVTFLIVSLVGLQLALQTEQLAPFFNTAPLTRWSRWVGVFGVVALSALLPGPNSLRVLLVLAALSCDVSVTHGRRVGSKFGQQLGAEWAPAAASAFLGLGSLVAVGRLVVGARKSSPPLALFQSAMLTATLWTGEKLGRQFVQLTGCIPCRRMAADPETFTLILAVLFTVFAIISYVPDAKPGSRVHISRLQIALVTVPVLVVAITRLFQHPLSPFTCSDGKNGELNILFSKKSTSGRIVVGDAKTENGFAYRYLRADHSVLGGQWLFNVSDGKGGTKPQLSDSIFAAFPLQEVLLLADRGDLAAPLRPAPGESALVIGLGVGIAATQFIRRGLKVDVVEYDQAVYDAAVKYFSYGTRHPRSFSIADGAKYVHDAAVAKRKNPDLARWNYVVQDCFTAGSLPVELFTREFWNDVQDVIVDDGLVVMNFAGVPDSKASRKVIRTLLSVFPQCRAFSDAELQRRDEPCNMVFVCSRAYDPLLTFRAPTDADIDRSPLRDEIYRTFLKREVPLDTLLLPGDWEDKDMVLRSGDRLEYWGDAVETWSRIDKIFTPEIWMAY